VKNQKLNVLKSRSKDRAPSCPVFLLPLSSPRQVSSLLSLGSISRSSSASPPRETRSLRSLARRIVWKSAAAVIAADIRFSLPRSFALLHHSAIIFARSASFSNLRRASSFSCARHVRTCAPLVLFLYAICSLRSWNAARVSLCRCSLLHRWFRNRHPPRRSIRSSEDSFGTKSGPNF